MKNSPAGDLKKNRRKRLKAIKAMKAMKAVVKKDGNRELSQTLKCRKSRAYDAVGPII